MTDIEIDLDPFSGELVRLRAVRDDDLVTLATWWNHPAVSALMNGASIQPKREADTIERLKEMSRNEGDDCRFAITVAETGELAGHCGLWGVQPKNRDATFGILIGPEFQNRGYGTDATRVLVRFGFQELDLHRISLEVYAFNPRAIAAYEKAGFVVEARRRAAVYRTGAWHDRILMGILRSDWRPPSRGVLPCEQVRGTDPR